MIRRGRFLVSMLLLLVLAVPVLRAQQHEDALSQKEIDQLRDSAQEPGERVLVFVGFLNDRTEAIQKLATGPRRAGREQDIHDLLEQFTSIVDEMEDNLDEYGPAHKDLRKALPKLLSATDRWATILKTPAENEAYSVSRKIALESLGDLREESTSMLDDQKAWFAAHPPPKENKSSPYGRE